MPHDPDRALAALVALAVCCGAAALLIAAGVLGLGGGLLGITGLMVTAGVLVAVAAWTILARRRTDGSG